MASAAEAFDRAAAEYDTGFGRNPIGLLFRHAFQERLQRLLPRGARVLDVGCGTGEDALALAAAGFRVQGIDVAPEMVARARHKAVSAGLPPERVQFEVVAAEDVARCCGPFDAAYSNFGALNCADLPLVGHGLAAVLRPGAPLLVSLIGPWPLPATLQRALTGRGERRRGSVPRVGGLAVAASYPGPADARRLLGEAFAWRGGFGLGIVVPDPDHAPWAWRHPQAFGVLAAFERLVRRWPGLRNLGDHVVLEGLRR